MNSKSKYSLNTGLAWFTSQNLFGSDKEAWNALAKDFDAEYKTGGKVMANLEKHGVPVTNIHIQQGLMPEYAFATQTVAVGYISFDWDGVPWNNPTFCKLCKCPITSQRFRDYGHCGECQPVINSIWAWNPPFKTMHSKERKPAKITQKQLDILKAESESAWSDADFLIRDGTLTLIKEKVIDNEE